MINGQTEVKPTMEQQRESIHSINGQDLKHLVEASLTWLRVNQQIVNSLNVFPIPDGDTGTNMLLTMQSAYKEIEGSNEDNVGKVAKDIAQGALMGARGNSGVILSQIWRGFARVLDNLPDMDAQILARALVESRNTAYKGVVRPVEGTILTVIKDVSIAVENSVNRSSDLAQILEDAVSAADESVKYTPELLPILKTAGVVDAGGKGLFFILEGMLKMLNGETLEGVAVSVQNLSEINLEEAMESIEKGQDIEVVIDFVPNLPLNLDLFYSDLSEMGTSIQIGEGEGMYRMHIHVPEENQDKPLAYIRKIGKTSKIAIEDLREQMAAITKKPQKVELNKFQPGTIAVVVVSPGLGISRIFASFGVAAIIEGGQTMNPSTEEILKSFENLPTDKIIILPNNKNIVLAANTAKNLSVKNVTVIPTVNIPQGFSAILRFDPEGDFDRICEEMEGSLNEVEAAEITVATRDVVIDGVDVKVDKKIGLLNGKLVISGDTVLDATLNLFEQVDMKSRERITLIYGSNITEPEVNQIASKIKEKYPDHEIEIHNGGQPHYYFIISIE